VGGIFFTSKSTQMGFKTEKHFRIPGAGGALNLLSLFPKNKKP
jgi:hypothetical protein